MPNTLVTVYSLKIHQNINLVRNICWIALLLLFPSLAFSQTTQKVRIACVGNSITEGYGLADPKSESYPSILQELLGEKYDVRNFGLSARTLMLKGNRPYMKEQKFEEAQAFLPDIVTIKLGTNDSKPQNWIHHAKFKNDLKTLIHKFQSLSSHPRIYLCLPIPGNNKEWGINDSIIYHKIIPYIKEVAAEEHLPVIDLYAAMLPYYPQKYQDGVHPNKDGAKIIAAQIYRVLTGEDDSKPLAQEIDRTLQYNDQVFQWEICNHQTERKQICRCELHLFTGTHPADSFNHIIDSMHIETFR
mgnify:FL=1